MNLFNIKRHIWKKVIAYYDAEFEGVKYKQPYIKCYICDKCKEIKDYRSDYCWSVQEITETQKEILLSLIKDNGSFYVIESEKHKPKGK